MQRTRTYECMCLLDNREVRKGWQQAKDSATALFSKHGAEILSARRWDERRLAFPIKGQQRATYLLAYMKVDTQQLAAIRRDLSFSETVLRGLIQSCDEIPPSAYEPEPEFDVNAIPVDDSPVRSSTEQPVDDATSTEEGSSTDAAAPVVLQGPDGRSVAGKAKAAGPVAGPVERGPEEPSDDQPAEPTEKKEDDA